jgi:hypothetical protein
VLLLAVMIVVAVVLILYLKNYIILKIDHELSFCHSFRTADILTTNKNNITTTNKNTINAHTTNLNINTLIH